MKKLLALVICLIFSEYLHAQHTVSGLVTEKRDKSVLLTGVRIYIPEFNRSDLSREGGTYILRNIGIGTVHIEFSKKGYKSFTTIINTTDSATVIHAELEFSGKEEDHLTASSGYSRFSTNEVFNVQVKESEKLANTGKSSLPGGLTYIPGIDNFSVGNISSPVINGMSSDRVLGIQSGSRIESFSSSELHDFELIENGTEYVEIIKGPAATVLYGDNANGGAIIYRDEAMPVAGTTSGDLRLRMFSNTLGLHVLAGVKSASENGFFYSLRLGNQSHVSYIQGSGTQFKKNTEQRDYAYNTGFRKSDAKATIGVNRKWGLSKLTIISSENDHEIVRSLNDSAIAVTNQDNERDRAVASPALRQSLFLVSSENIVLIKKSQIKINLSFQKNTLKSDYQSYLFPTADLIIPTSYHDGFNSDFSYISNPAKKVGIIAGTQMFARKSKTDNLFSTDVKGFGSYVLLRYDISKFNFLLGSRVEPRKIETSVPKINYNQNVVLVGFSGGLAWHPVTGLTLKANTSGGYSTPGDKKESYDYTIRGITEGNRNLTEEKNIEALAGISWDTKDVTINLEGFNNAISDYTYEEFSDYINLYSQNKILFRYAQSDANINGGTISFNIHPENIKWLVLESSYSMISGVFKKSKEKLPYMPADKIVSAIKFQSEKMNYVYNSYISVVFRNYMKQDRVSIYEHPTDAYSLIDLRMGGSFHWAEQTFDISLVVNNMLNTGYYSHLSPLKYLRPVAIRETGRNISLQLHVPFGLSRKTS